MAVGPTNRASTDVIFALVGSVLAIMSGFALTTFGVLSVVCIYALLSVVPPSMTGTEFLNALFAKLLGDIAALAFSIVAILAIVIGIAVGMAGLRKVYVLREWWL